MKYLFVLAEVLLVAMLPVACILIIAMLVYPLNELAMIADQNLLKLINDLTRG